MMHSKWIGTAVLVGAIVFLAACNETGTKVLADLSKVTKADVQRGYDIAKAKDDKAGMACSAAILAALPSDTSKLTDLAPIGVWSAYMDAREVARSLRGGPKGLSEDVHNACAPLVVDAEELLVRLGINYVK